MPEICGIATITAGQVSVTIIHGLGGIPLCPLATPADDLGGRDFWVDNVTAVSFRINISAPEPPPALGGVNHQFYYYAQV